MVFWKQKKANNQSILFICTANITRSPVAEAMFRRITEEAGEDWEVGSAGVNASNGMMPNQVVAFIMSRRNIPISSHCSRKVTSKLLSQYMWIVVMEEAHKDAILSLNSELKDRVFVFREIANDEILDDYDMPDPTGKEESDYRVLFRILGEEIPKVYQVIQNKAWNLEWQENQ